MKQLYAYSCTSRSGAAIVGTYLYRTLKWNRDELNQGVMGNIACFVQSHNVPWDPFNIELIVKAQTEPKLKFQEVK